jgi:hypothetical protein
MPTPYDHGQPFRLAITITKGDDKAQVLTRMARGTIVAFKTAEDAEKGAKEFIDLASKITGNFNVYGVVTVMDEQHSKITFSEII